MRCVMQIVLLSYLSHWTDLSEWNVLDRDSIDLKNPVSNMDQGLNFRTQVMQVQPVAQGIFFKREV